MICHSCAPLLISFATQAVSVSRVVRQLQRRWPAGQCQLSCSKDLHQGSCPEAPVYATGHGRGDGSRSSHRANTVRVGYPCHCNSPLQRPEARQQDVGCGWEVQLSSPPSFAALASYSTIKHPQQLQSGPAAAFGAAIGLNSMS